MNARSFPHCVPRGGQHSPEVRYHPLVLLPIICLAAPALEAKSIPVGTDGSVPGSVASPMMGQGSYVKGVKQVAVPLIAVAFETSAEARVTHAGGDKITTKSLELHLKVENAVLQAVCAELQAMVEKDLAAQGFEILPKESIDSDARWQGIAKDGKPGEDVKDNFMSGFMGNGTMNRWFTAQNRPLFGTGATGALAETSPLIRTARERKISLLFYRFKVQFTDLEGRNKLVYAYVKGKNVLRLLSADVSVFTPEHTNGGMIKLTDTLTAGADFVEELQGSPGKYNVVANPEHYKADALLLIQGASRQFAQALRKAQ